MLQIKTIREPLERAHIFDDRVNRAIMDGWTLTRREVLHPGQEYTFFSLYAEMEQEAIAPHEHDCAHCLYGELDGGDPCDYCDPNIQDKWEPKPGCKVLEGGANNGK